MYDKSNGSTMKRNCKQFIPILGIRRRIVSLLMLGSLPLLLGATCGFETCDIFNCDTLFFVEGFLGSMDDMHDDGDEHDDDGDHDMVDDDDDMDGMADDHDDMDGEHDDDMPGDDDGHTDDEHADDVPSDDHHMEDGHDR